MSNNTHGHAAIGGKKENIHIPRYIKNQPWFYKDASTTKDEGEEDDYLIHHRQSKKGGDLDIDNNSEPKVGSGIKDEFETVTFTQKRKGTYAQCLNCGSANHNRKDCLERPKKSHKTGTKEEAIISVRKDSHAQLNWDARKDRWYGYSGKEYDNVIKSWQEKRKKEENSKRAILESEQELLWDTDEEVELTKLGLYKDSVGTLKQDDFKNSQLQRASVRLREDRAAYLNDVNSSEIKYDPKSRLYKSDSLGSTDEKSRMFRRHLTGEAQELNELNKFSREHTKKLGLRDEIEDESRVKHVLVANPTKYEQMMKEQKRMQSQGTGTDHLSDLEASKKMGTAQSAAAKKHLKDLYG